MKLNGKYLPAFVRRRNLWLLYVFVLMTLWPARADASIFKGEALDKVAGVLTWVVLVVAPIVAVAVFLLIHILPEKIAEKKQHPQTKAIQCLCLLSLFFGGLLWPLAWLWAYTRPVLHKLAYGSDTLPHGERKDSDTGSKHAELTELDQLRNRVAELEAKLSSRPIVEGGKA